MTSNKFRQVPFVAQFQRVDVAAWIVRMLQKRGINAQVASGTNVLVQRHTDREALLDLWQTLPILPSYVTLLGQAHGMTYVALTGGTVWRWTGITWLFEALPTTWPSHPAYRTVCGVQAEVPEDNNKVLTIEAVEMALTAEVRTLVQQQARRYAGEVMKTPFVQLSSYLDSEALALLVRDLEDYTGHQIAEHAIARLLRLVWTEGNRRVGAQNFGAIVSEYES